MKIPAIWIFSDDKDYEDDFKTECIKNLITLGIEPCVDARHKNDCDWRFQNFKKCPHRFYDKSLNAFFQVHEDDGSFNCSLVIAFNEDVEISEMEWMTIFIWVTGRFSEDCLLIDKPHTIKVKCDEIVKDVKDEGYSLKTFLSDDDIMFYQITKPKVEVPYTTIIEKFSVVGHFDFFTNLFICESWGCGTDVQFLEELWKFFAMTGEFNLDKMYYERVQRCIRGESEPVVYRAELDDVVQTIEEKKNGVECGHKRKSVNLGGVLKK